MEESHYKQMSTRILRNEVHNLHGSSRSFALVFLLTLSYPFLLISSVISSFILAILPTTLFTKAVEIEVLISSSGETDIADPTFLRSLSTFDLALIDLSVLARNRYVNGERLDTCRWIWRKDRSCDTGVIHDKVKMASISSFQRQT